LYTSRQPDSARIWATRLGKTRNPAAHRLHMLLAAFDSAAAGHFQAALTATDSLMSYDPVNRQGDPFARAVLYLSRGEWLINLQQWKKAEATLLWYENGDIDGWGQREAQAGMVDGAISAVARIRRAGALRALGNTKAACAHVSRVAQLWSEADPSFRS